ncbi:MAG TPA: hypothetical protein PK706_25790, partial [Xanthobacteraceae bacterium]|nr:hypothetical protein [Xanthobacteraceae bacterium]
MDELHIRLAVRPHHRHFFFKILEAVAGIEMNTGLSSVVLAQRQFRKMLRGIGKRQQSAQIEDEVLARGMSRELRRTEGERGPVIRIQCR